MTIPTEVIMRMATIGLSEEQAKAVAEMLVAVEEATKSDVLSRVVMPSREANRARVARYHERLGLSAHEWRDIRLEVFARDGRQCTYCGSTAEPLHIDHIVPLIQGGGNDLGNLAVACRECNCGKSGRTLDQWVAH